MFAVDAASLANSRYGISIAIAELCRMASAATCAGMEPMGTFPKVEVSSLQYELLA